MVLADWSKISGADLQLIKRACHLSYGAISKGSESRYIHNGTENVFYVSQGMSTWFGLVAPSSDTVKVKVGGILKYYDSDNYIYAYLEIEIDSEGDIISAKVVYRKREGGSETTILEDDVTTKIQHLSGMITWAGVDVDDFEDGTTQGWEGDVEVVDEGYEGAKSLKVTASCGAEPTKSCSNSKHGYKIVDGLMAAKVLAKKYYEAVGVCADLSQSAKIEGSTPPDDWGWMNIAYPGDSLDVRCSVSGTAGNYFCGVSATIWIDTAELIYYPSLSWAFVKFYGWLKQIEGKWYLDIEVRVSDNYYTSPDTSVEPSTTVISSCLVEIPSTIVGNNTKCGIILGREASDWIGQNCPNIVIDYTKLFY